MGEARIPLVITIDTALIRPDLLLVLESVEQEIETKREDPIRFVAPAPLAPHSDQGLIRNGRRPSA